MSSAKKRRETIRRNEAILAARPKTANGAKRTDKTEGDAARLPAPLPRPLRDHAAPQVQPRQDRRLLDHPAICKRA
jgi:hypothetical protein